jgi:hypothetical protein
MSPFAGCGKAPMLGRTFRLDTSAGFGKRASMRFRAPPRSAGPGLSTTFLCLGASWPAHDSSDPAPPLLNGRPAGSGTGHPARHRLGARDGRFCIAPRNNPRTPSRSGSDTVEACGIVLGMRCEDVYMSERLDEALQSIVADQSPLLAVLYSYSWNSRPQGAALPQMRAQARATTFLN